MATEATFTVPSETFPLGTVFEALPNIEVELERVVPGASAVIPYFWARNADTDDIEAAFSAHPGVTDIRLVDSIQDEYLLRVEWETEYVGILTTLTETGVVLIEAVGTDEQWTFDVRGDSRDDVAQFLQLCRDRDISYSLTALHALTPVQTATEAAVTDPQQEVLELGISQQAVASRLRRGTRRILGKTLTAAGKESSSL